MQKQNDVFYIQEAFKKLQFLNEDSFNLQDVGVVDELTSFVADDKDAPWIEEIIDVESDFTDELQDSYVGKVILQCKCCNAKIYKDASEVFVSEEDNCANIEEECPLCGNAYGWSVIGKIEPYNEEEFKEEEPVEADLELDLTDDEINEALKKSISEDLDIHVQQDENGNVEEVIIEKEPEDVVNIQDESQEELVDENCHKKNESVNESVDPQRVALTRLKKDLKSWPSDIEYDFATEGDVRVGGDYDLFQIFVNKDGSIGYSDIDNREEDFSNYDEFMAWALSKHSPLDRSIFKKNLTVNESVEIHADQDADGNVVVEVEVDEGEHVEVVDKEEVLPAEDIEVVEEGLDTKYVVCLDGEPVTDEFDNLEIAREEANKLWADHDYDDKFEDRISIERVSVYEESLKEELKHNSLEDVTIDCEEASKDACQLENPEEEPVKEELNEDLEVGKIYKSPNAGSYKFIDIVETKEGKLYKFKPLNKLAVKTSKEVAVDEPYAFDGEYSYMPRETVEYTFFDTVNESLNEDIENLSLDTESTHMEMTSDENGKVTVITEPREEVEEVVEVEDEMIAPLTDEEKAEIENNEEVVDEPVEDEFEIDEFEEETFNELGESFLKRVYENVNSFKTSSVAYKKGQLVVEGLIKFNSGKEKSTSFIFEKFKNTKRNKVVVTGLNETFSKSKSAFMLKGDLKNKKFVSESLIYNYSTHSLNESNKQEAVKVYGRAIVRNK